MQLLGAEDEMGTEWRCLSCGIPMEEPYEYCGLCGKKLIMSMVPESPNLDAASPKAGLERRLEQIKLIVVNNVEEVTIPGGAVVGYTLNLDPEQTRVLWNFADQNVPLE